MGIAHSRTIEILLVEDNPGDIRLTQEILKEMVVPFRLSVVRDGEEAMAFLRRQEAHRQAPQPDLILLDLNLPRKNGREVLTEIKQDPALQRIPVLVMTSSRDESDIVRAFDLHPDSYLVKPFGLQEASSVARSIESFCLRVVEALPAG